MFFFKILYFFWRKIKSFYMFVYKFLQLLKSKGNILVSLWETRILHAFFTYKNVGKLWYLPQHINRVYRYYLKKVKKKILIRIKMLHMFKRSFFVFRTMRRAYWLEGKDLRPFTEKYWSRTVAKYLRDLHKNNLFFYTITSVLHFLFFFAFFFAFIFFHVTYQIVVVAGFYVVKWISGTILFVLGYLSKIFHREITTGVVYLVYTYLWYIFFMYFFFFTRYSGRYLAYASLHYIAVWVIAYFKFWIVILKILLYTLPVVIYIQDTLEHLPYLWLEFYYNFFLIFDFIRFLLSTYSKFDYSYWIITYNIFFNVYIYLCSCFFILQDYQDDYFVTLLGDWNYACLIQTFFILYRGLFFFSIQITNIWLNLISDFFYNFSLVFSLICYYCFISFSNNMFFEFLTPVVSIYALVNTYVFLLILNIVILILITFNFFFLGKINFYKFYNLCFFCLFIISVYVQYNIFNLDELTINLDITQNYIYFYNHIFSFNFGQNFLYFSTTTVQIAFFVNLFSIFYLSNDQKYEKFILLLNYFVFSMILLIHANNFIMIFLFWELIGITSYFLINFYELKSVSFKSAFKAFSFNRVSDVSLLVSIIIFWNATGSFSINEPTLLYFICNSTSYSIFFFKLNTLTLFLIFLTIASFCKSAQFGFHFWLPDSMEAPAPASALIHSATLVSAGLVLYVKFITVYKFDAQINIIVLIIATVTVVFGSIVSSVQTDLKRLLAYSTISNCGLLFVSVVLSNLQTTLCLFQFHGLTKSLSFLFVGYIIILYGHNQDMRIIGSQNFLLKLVFINMFTVLSYLSAWSWAPSNILKHIIFVPTNFINYIFLIKFLLIFSTVFSLMYSLRIVFFNAFVNKKYKKNTMYTYVNYKNVNNILYCFFGFCIFMFYVKFFSLFFTNNPITNNSVFITYKIFLWIFVTTFIVYFFFYSSNKIKKSNLKQILFLSFLFFILLL